MSLVKNKVFLARNGFSPYGGVPDPFSKEYWRFDSGMCVIQRTHCNECRKKTNHIVKYPLPKMRSVDIETEVLSRLTAVPDREIYDFNGNLINYCKTEVLNILIRKAPQTECRVCLNRELSNKIAQGKNTLDAKIAEQQNKFKSNKRGAFK